MAAGVERNDVDSFIAQATLLLKFVIINKISRPTILLSLHIQVIKNEATGETLGFVTIFQL